MAKQSLNVRIDGKTYRVVAVGSKATMQRRAAKERARGRNARVIPQGNIYATAVQVRSTKRRRSKPRSDPFGLF